MSGAGPTSHQQLNPRLAGSHQPPLKALTLVPCPLKHTSTHTHPSPELLMTHDQTTQLKSRW